MKTEELKKLYPVTPQMHRSVENTLQRLDNAAPERYRRRKSVRRFVIVFAVILVTAALTTAAYATQLFGLLTEKVGKYGVDLRVVEESSPSPSSARIHMMPNPTYLPEGCRQMIGGEDEDHLILNPEGVTSYNKNGNYKYTDGNDTWVHFHVYEADKFHEEARYIVDRKETEYNGHKTVFLTRQFEENGDRDQYAIKYFEDCGYVVDCYYLDMTELRKIMEGLELREAEDDRDTPTVDNINDPVDPYAGYAFSMEEEQREYRLGHDQGDQGRPRLLLSRLRGLGARLGWVSLRRADHALQLDRRHARDVRGLGALLLGTHELQRVSRRHLPRRGEPHGYVHPQRRHGRPPR